MKFGDFKYNRPHLDTMEKEVEELLKEFDSSENPQEQSRVIEKITEIRNHFETMYTLVSIRHSIDTRDSFYEKEQVYMDENSPRYTNMITKFYSSLVGSQFKEELSKVWGEQLFRLAELQIKTFSEEIMEDLVVENKLSTKYDKLVAAAAIQFEGQTRNLSQLRPFMESPDRGMRKKAYNAYTSYFEENEEEIGDIYDQLVKIRDRMAKKLGYENFIQMGYDRMSRSDYNHNMVRNFREQVLQSIVPLASKIKDRQKKRLLLEELTYYDEPLQFLSGNANPKGGPEWILDKGIKMYKELSSETGEFFDFMVENELLDLLSKEGKRSGGYCTVIPDYKAPFIFSNFNGTSGDIDVLTHEAGHAFQTYMSMDLELPEYKFPTLEACEIHSMSMEFLTWPWMESFFEEGVDKYKYSHLEGAVSFLPYGVTVDEFQHIIYQRPNLTPDERKKVWRDLEKKYLPFKDYSGNSFLESGGYWMRQGHIFSNPFYYIDYCLAQVCAFQFWRRSLEDSERAWKDYLELCKAGGSMAFIDLVDLAGLKSPFQDGTVQYAIKPVKEFLENIDDRAL
ncbi:M3 family oligoendopeptidase [Gudongella sp. DL1XJH-153]|uniref:M3 family oligoendopeptidase n=1 Tax=Gudongella sp. DL1XJH-153 TaxID=3409804 RepID=UPI003BB7F97D